MPANTAGHERWPWVRQALSRRDEFFWLRVVGGSTAIALALVTAIVNGIDEVFLIVAGIAALLLAFPWQRLSSLRAGPFEFSLEQGQIKGALEAIEIEGGEKQRLTHLLSRLATDVERARGSRVLWIDDIPLRILGERRLFRALDIETVVVTSSRDAAGTLKRDNDFDLIITSLEKATEKKLLSGNDDRRPGVVFVQWLRGVEDDAAKRLTGAGAIADPVINNIAVIYYTGFRNLTEIRRDIRAAAELGPGVEVARTFEDLLKKSIRALADARSHPIEVPLEGKKVSA